MRSVKYILLLIWSIASLSATASESVTIQAKLDKSSGVVGELRTLTLQVKGAPLDSVSWEQVASAFTDQIILQEQAIAESGQGFTYQVIFTSAQEGEVVLKPIVIDAYFENTKKTLLTDSIKAVFTSEKLIASLHDIQPVRESGLLAVSLLKAVVTVISILVLLLGIWLFFKYKYQKRNQANPQTDSTYALRQINELESQFHKGIKSGKLVSYEVAEQLKTYFKNSYGIDEAFITTHEFQSTLKALYFNAEQIQEITEVLADLERVRFSHHAVDASFYTSLLARVKVCIHFHPEAVTQI